MWDEFLSICQLIFETKVEDKFPCFLADDLWKVTNCDNRFEKLSVEQVRLQKSVIQNSPAVLEFLEEHGNILSDVQKNVNSFRCQGDPKLQNFGLNELRLASSRFDGTGCLKTFLKKFEICARYNNWNLVDMEAYLSCSLTGEASQVLWDLTGLGYQELVSKLEDRFGTRGHEESYRYELQILRRKP
ncbi:hypothetical protein HELRODRAFT_184367, partial [Helobdella robusta]|uniref:Uncharacterized protein n=1 Tax=Helobdella robusta TaxID=6412 RepID=T1FL24_HELRO